MNPKAAEAWNFALAKMESARQLIENGQDEQAKTEIAKAVYVGAGALYYLFGPGQEEQVAYQAAQSFIAEMADRGFLRRRGLRRRPERSSPTSPPYHPPKTGSRHRRRSGREEGEKPFPAFHRECENVGRDGNVSEDAGC